MRRLVQVLVVSALVLTGCGGDDDDDDVAADPAAADAEVEARLAAVVERLGAAGFEESDEPEDEDDAPFEFESDDCRQFDELFPEDADELPGEIAEAETGTYTRGSLDTGTGEQSIEAAVAVVSDPDDDELERVLELVEDDQFGACIEEAARIGVEEEAEPGMAFEFELSTESVEPPDFVDAGGGAHVTGTIGALGFTFDVELEVWMVRVDDRAGLLFVSSVGERGEPVDAEAYLELLVA